MDNMAFSEYEDEPNDDLPSLTPSSVPSSLLTSLGHYGTMINVNRSIAYCQDFYLQVDSSDIKKKNKKFTKYYEFLKQFSHQQFSKCNFTSLLFGFFPILHWLPNYKKTDLLPDIITGCTILALHIPQGLAYGHLAGAEPINGLYVSLFPVVIYLFLGTSRHISIGTFAVISIACKDVLEDFQLNQPHNITLSSLNEISSENNVQPIDILTALCFLVGSIQLVLGILKFGIISILLPDTLISAFVVGSAIHVFTNQIFEFIGIESSKTDDYEIPIPMDIIKAYISFFIRIHKTNVATLILSLICITFLISCKYVLEPFLMKKFKLKTITIPIDISLVIFVTMASSFMDLNGRYGVHIIPNIPNGFTGMPKVPNMSILVKLIPGAIMVCLISFLLTYSLGKMYAKQHDYKINPNQELIALGAANLISSFFLCYPCCSSLARSAVQERVGGRTQIASIVSSIFMILVLFFLTTHLQTLPKCVLSCIIMVALYSTIKRIREVRDAWKISKLDGILWIFTFLFVILFGVGHGLLYSILFSFAILIFKLINPTIKLKYRLKDSEIFIETPGNQILHNREQFFNCLSKNGWIVFEFQGPLIFINSLFFRIKFYSIIGNFLVELFERKFEGNNNEGKGPPHRSSFIGRHVELHQKPNYVIILDCSRMNYIDNKGAEALLDTVNLMEKYNTQLVLASCSRTIYENLEKLKFFDKFNPIYCYMSVIDAIIDNEL